MEQNEIKKIIAEKLAAGISLTEIQKILADKHDVRMKFLELRLMASELENIDWTKLNKKEEKKTEAPVKPESAVNGDEDIPEDEDFPEDEITDDEDAPQEKSGGVRGKTTVELAKVMRPGSVANGSVKFGSGATAEWVLDQFGRLGLDKASGKPDQQDIKEFQMELQKLLSR